MKKAVKSADELRRLALSKGAELVLNGKPFNSTRQVVKAAPRPPSAPPASPGAPAPSQPPAAQGITREELVQLLDERDARTQQAIQHLHTLLAQVLAAPQPQAAAPRGPWRFAVEYDKSGAIKGLVATPGPAPEQAAADEWRDPD